MVGEVISFGGFRKINMCLVMDIVVAFLLLTTTSEVNYLFGSLLK